MASIETGERVESKTLWNVKYDETRKTEVEISTASRMANLRWAITCGVVNKKIFKETVIKY